MASDILRERLHAHIDAVRECVEQDSRRIRIVQRGHDAATTGNPRNCRNVLDFHRDGSRTLAPDQLSVITAQTLDVAADRRVVVLSLDIDASQKAAREIAARSVHTVGDEYMPARAHEAQ